MTVGSSQAKINSIVELLFRSAPEAIESLASRFPDQREELQPGLQLGGARSDAQSFLLNLAREGISAAELQIKQLLVVIPSRLTRARRWRLAATIVSTVTSAGVVSAALAEARVATIVGSSLALAASLFGLFAQHIEAPLFGSSAGLSEVIEAMLRAEARVPTLKLELAQAGGKPTTQLDLIVRSVNALCAEVRRAQVQCGLG
jgi:hypothetical protein